MQPLKDYGSNKAIYSSSDIITSNLCSIVTQTLVKDSAYIYSTDYKISGNSLSLLRLFKLTSTINNQIIFSQKETGKGISIETNASGYLSVNINGTSFFSVKLELNKVYCVGLTYNGSLIKLNVNGVKYQESFSANIIESSVDLTINLTGQSGIIFCSDEDVYTDLDIICSNVFYLATNYRISKNTNTLAEPIRGEIIGVGTSTVGTIPADTADLVYDALPISFSGNISDAVLHKTSLLFINDSVYREYRLNSFIHNSQIVTQDKIYVDKDGYAVLYDTSGNIFSLKMINPASGRALAYTRKKNTSDYTHTWYIDNSQVDSRTTANEFEVSSLCDIPVSVEGSDLTIAPSNYVIDDLIVDDTIYVQSQVRAYKLADELRDDLNVKVKIAGVRNFSNEIIYSVDSTSLPTDLQAIADANKEIKKITTYTAE